MWEKQPINESGEKAIVEAPKVSHLQAILCQSGICSNGSKWFCQQSAGQTNWSQYISDDSSISSTGLYSTRPLILPPTNNPPAETRLMQYLP